MQSKPRKIRGQIRHMWHVDGTIDLGRVLGYFWKDCTPHDDCNYCATAHICRAAILGQPRLHVCTCLDGQNEKVFARLNTYVIKDTSMIDRRKGDRPHRMVPAQVAMSIDTPGLRARLSHRQIGFFAD